MPTPASAPLRSAALPSRTHHRAPPASVRRQWQLRQRPRRCPPRRTALVVPSPSVPRLTLNRKALIVFLRANVDVFAWQPSDIPGVPRKVIEHHLAVCPHARPVKQKVRKQAVERQEFITEEIRKLEAAGLVRGVLHPTWLANPVVVRKENGKWRLCIDYIDINKACPKDPFPFPRIDQIVDSTAGCDLLSFLDAYSSYHQIFMTREDEEKTTFITPCGTYCFLRMPFGLKSAGSTFARAVQIGFELQIHRNMEAYMDDIVVKTKDGPTLVRDLEETFANLYKINLKLNPEKCVFGVPSGKLLGFFVSQHGIEANPDKIKSIEQIEAPERIKDVHRLTGCVPAMSRF